MLNEITIGLSVHLSQVHKETLEHVEDALPNRNNTQLEIFAMEGVPQDVMDQHRQRVIREYSERHGNRQSSSNQAAENANKKPKLESKEEMKARLAAFKAKKANGELPTSANGNGTPTQVKAEEQSLVVPYDHNQGAPQSPGPLVRCRDHFFKLTLTFLCSKVGISYTQPHHLKDKYINLLQDSSLHQDFSLLTNHTGNRFSQRHSNSSSRPFHIM